MSLYETKGYVTSQTVKNGNIQYITNIKNSIQTTKAQISEQLSAQKGLSLFGQTILEQQFMLLKALEDWEINFEKQIFEREE